MPSSPFGVDELVYADDTLLVGVNARLIQSLMVHIGKVGRTAGLSFNWSKLESLAVRMKANIQRPDCGTVDENDSLIYFGSALAANGRIGLELGRGIGLAQCDFRSLQCVWAHSCLPRAGKV